MDAVLRETFRDLVVASANGEEISEAQFKQWALEERLIRSALEHGSAYASCGLNSLHFSAPGHRAVWRAIESLMDKDPEVKSIGAPALLLELASIDGGVVMTGRRAAIWFASVVREEPMPVSQGISIVVKELKQYARTVAWKTRFDELGGFVGKEADVDKLERAYLESCAQVSLEFAGDLSVPQPVTEYHWDPSIAIKPDVYRTGIDQIDSASAGGIGRGEMFVVGGGTGHGKSYFAVTLCRSRAAAGGRIAYVSCEDHSDLFYCRLLSSYSDGAVPPDDLRLRRTDPRVVEKLQRSLAKECADRLIIHYEPKCSASRLTDLMWSLRHGVGVDTVVVDYVQAVSGELGYVNKTQEMSSVVSRLKRTAGQSGLALVLFSQYARDSYRDGIEPHINAFKYCGDIENEAELVALLWKDKHGLHVRLPKAKWTSRAGRKYYIPVSQVTGCLGPWEDEPDFPADPESSDGDD